MSTGLEAEESVKEAVEVFKRLSWEGTVFLTSRLSGSLVSHSVLKLREHSVLKTK